MQPTAHIPPVCSLPFAGCGQYFTLQAQALGRAQLLRLLWL